ncbi:MAG: hypothetical protein FWF46_04760 [Oscillospiraceae bacterium]|nr:hypothetical protein [Oscillospiraceae bacterium]
MAPHVKACALQVTPTDKNLEFPLGQEARQGEMVVFARVIGRTKKTRRITR